MHEENLRWFGSIAAEQFESGGGEIQVLKKSRGTLGSYSPKNTISLILYRVLLFKSFLFNFYIFKFLLLLYSFIRNSLIFFCLRRDESLARNSNKY